MVAGFRRAGFDFLVRYSRVFLGHFTVLCRLIYLFGSAARFHCAGVILLKGIVSPILSFMHVDDFVVILFPDDHDIPLGRQKRHVLQIIDRAAVYFRLRAFSRPFAT